MAAGNPTVTDVVAAVLHRNNTFLACRRSVHLTASGQWEFPGGKRNLDETAVEALQREIAEELNVRIVVGESLGKLTHRYTDKTIRLECFLINHWNGEFELSDHDRMQWCSLDELTGLNLSAADIPFVDRLRQYFLTV